MGGMTGVDIKKLRKSLGLTQDEFCARFGFEIGTLRHWEQQQRSPTGPARVLLMVIEQAPDVVQQAIEAAQPRVCASGAV